MSNSFATSWAVSNFAPLSGGFPRQESWSGFPFPSSGDLPDPGIKPGAPALVGRFFTTEPPGKPSWSGREKIMELKHQHMDWQSASKKRLFWNNFKFIEAFQRRFLYTLHSTSLMLLSYMSIGILAKTKTLT